MQSCPGARSREGDRDMRAEGGARNLPSRPLDLNADPCAWCRMKHPLRCKPFPPGGVSWEGPRAATRRPTHATPSRRSHRSRGTRHAGPWSILCCPCLRLLLRTVPPPAAKEVVLARAGARVEADAVRSGAVPAYGVVPSRRPNEINTPAFLVVLTLAGGRTQKAAEARPRPAAGALADLRPGEGVSGRQTSVIITKKSPLTVCAFCPLSLHM